MPALGAGSQLARRVLTASAGNSASGDRGTLSTISTRCGISHQKTRPQEATHSDAQVEGRSFCGSGGLLLELRSAREQTYLHGNGAPCKVGVDLAGHVSKEAIDGGPDCRLEAGAQPEADVQHAIAEA